LKAKIWLDESENDRGYSFFFINIHPDYERLEDYELITKILEEQCNCIKIDDQYIVYIRRIEFKKKNIEFSLYIDSMDGVYLCAKTEFKSDLSKIAYDLFNTLTEYIDSLF